MNHLQRAASRLRRALSGRYVWTVNAFGASGEQFVAVRTWRRSALVAWGKARPLLEWHEPLKVRVAPQLRGEPGQTFKPLSGWELRNTLRLLANRDGEIEHASDSTDARTPRLCRNLPS